ncbi:hypothetical protein MKEN_01499100 [Mycena kentingensis (nom. inval.)]|nr:hypothetical protein MKEN_01499100 [Mycena kentingensis (nom. inval.)]
MHPPTLLYIALVLLGRFTLAQSIPLPASADDPIDNSLVPAASPDASPLLLNLPSETPSPVPAPVTVTDVVTVFLPSSASPTSRSTPPASPPLRSYSNSPSAATWTAPPQMSDLSSFKISHFAAGKQNLRLVNGIPASATRSPSPTPSSGGDGGLLNIPGLGPLLQGLQAAASPSPSPAPSDQYDAYTTWDNKSTAMQLLYPAGSANPRARPQGGAEFYASPLSVADSSSLSLAYSAFFPYGFDWVHGGKMPGLYGGKTGCSGGDEASDCFSTRLMWREGGQGELYLYAPRDKQTSALCKDKQSDCNAVYGFSIGRGSFTWATGRWTHVRQFVKLNTDCQQNGVFKLVVNGVTVIHREDIYYRGCANPSKTKSSAPSSTADGGLAGILPTLGSIIGELVGIARRSVAIPDAVPFVLAPSRPTMSPERPHLLAGPDGVVLSSTEDSELLDVFPDHNTTMRRPTSDQSATKSGAPAGFLGIFFSTFFGGHGSTYVTPYDQYVWFKDFGLVSYT